MRFKFLLLYLVVIFTFLGTSLPLKALASSPDDINVTTTPDNPTPNQNVTITLSSYVDDLNSTLISWSIAGKKISSGIGDKSISTNAPALGSQTTITATLSLSDGDLVKTIMLRPSVMVLLWQANDSYVPPFYKGKAMPSPDSSVKVVALPQIKTGASLIDPKNMTYAWQLDYTNDQGSSGYGKNYFIYTNDYLDDTNNVGVTATTVDQKYSSTGSLDIGTTMPKIEFYKNDSTLGTLWNQALLDGHQVFGDEVMQAAPYFISPKDIRIPFLSFNWYINDEQIAVPLYSKNLFPIKAQTGTSGTANLKLEIDSSEKITETASKTISVSF